MRQIETAVLAESDFSDILARVLDLRGDLFLQRCRPTSGAAISARPVAAVLQVIRSASRSTSPGSRILRLMPSFVHRKDSTMLHRDAVLYAVAIVALNGMNALLVNQFFILAMHNGMKVRVAVCSVIYRKALRLSQTALGETAPGKVVNLLSNDVNRFDIVSLFLNAMWTAPLMAIISGYLLWTTVGWAGMIGIAVVFVVVPIQSEFGRRMGHESTPSERYSLQVTRANYHPNFVCERRCVPMSVFASWMRSFLAFR